MEERNEKYFNFPIQLLEDFLINKNEVLSNISRYSVYFYGHSYLSYTEGLDMFNESAAFFNISFVDEDIAYKRGEMLYESMPLNSPMVGLNLSIFWDFIKNEKTEFEKITLLGFLAIKSILQKKSYCKITNKFWLSRMDGKAKAVSDTSNLSDSILKYAVHYQLRKIKAELERSWNLKTVSGRGFNVSFTMSFDALFYEVLKGRKKYKDFEILKIKNEAKEKALLRIYGTQPKDNL